MENYHAPMRLLMLIATPRLSGRAAALFDEGRVPVQYRLSGHGTASREVLDMLGLDSGDKTVLLSVLPKPFADDMLGKLRRALRLSGVRRPGLAALPLCILYAAGDEFHQSFTEGRGPSPVDVAIDSAGALLMWGLLAILERIRKRAPGLPEKQLPAPGRRTA